MELTQGEKDEILHHQRLQEMEARLEALDVLCDLLRDQDWDELDLTLLKGQYLGNPGPWASRLELVWEEGPQAQELLQLAGWTPPPPVPVWLGVDYGGAGDYASHLLRYSDGHVVPFNWLPEEEDELVVQPDEVYDAQRALIVSTKDRGVHLPRRGDRAHWSTWRGARGRPLPRRGRREWWQRNR